nr:immunoglobulin heavy chain junction region [Mus musculus]
CARHGNYDPFDYW